MSSGVNCLDGTVLETLLGADGVDELKKQIIEVIVNEVREQLHESNNYIVSPDDISSYLFDEVVSEIKNEIVSLYRSKIMESVDKKISAIM